MLLNLRDVAGILAYVAFLFIASHALVWTLKKLRDRWRFSLRSLLIVTTLVAIVLGLASGLPARLFRLVECPAGGIS
jgi:hypothetical protein